MGSECTRYQRLYEGHQRISGNIAHNELADRFSLLYLSNGLETICKTELQNIKLSQGVIKRTAALELLAKSCSVSFRIIKYDSQKSRNYFEFLKIAGPGSLIEMGPAGAGP